MNKLTGTDGQFRTFENISCKNGKTCRGCTEQVDELQSRSNTVTCNFCEANDQIV